MTKGNQPRIRRIHAGRYEIGAFGIRKIEESWEWQTFRLDREETIDGGWMQTYGTLRDAKEGVLAVIAEEG